MARINWSLVRHDYIHGRVQKNGKYTKYTCNDLAKKYRCSVSAVTKKCNEDNWPKNRSEYWLEVEKELSDKKKESLTDQVLSFDQDIFKTASYAATILGSKLLKEVTDIDGASGETVVEIVINMEVPTLEVRRVMEALKLAQDVRMTAMSDIVTSAGEDSLQKLCELVAHEREMRHIVGV